MKRHPGASSYNPWLNRASRKGSAVVWADIDIWEVIKDPEKAIDNIKDLRYSVKSIP